jgi:hypothetical protein
MSERSRRLLLWTPRILAILVSLFLGVFALDAFGSGRSFAEALPDFALHLTPMLFLLTAVVVSWRWEWVGGWLFTGLGIAHAYLAREHLSWVLCISVPLIAVGILYGWNWRHHGELHTHASP